MELFATFRTFILTGNNCVRLLRGLVKDVQIKSIFLSFYCNSQAQSEQSVFKPVILNHSALHERK